MNIPLSPRLQVCAGLIFQGSRVADVGCDHGYLGLHLLQSGRASYVYAADINEGPLQSAIRNAEKYGYSDQMSFYLSNGLRNVPRDFDQLICAGMGADTIISILEAAPWLKGGKYELILQCQSKTPTLRRYLSENGWRIGQEYVVRDGKFLYTVMSVDYKPEFCHLTVGQWYFCPGLLDDPSYETIEYYHYVVEGLRIATMHRQDQEKLQALRELEALAQELPMLRKEKPMPTVSDLLNFVQTLAPTYMKESWDNVGLNCGHLDAPVRKVLVALDPFEAIDEAIELGVDLLLTHHALLWKPGFITDGDMQGKRTLALIENRIAHINAHTNLDMAPGGVNDVLAQKLGLTDIRVITPTGKDADGNDYGLLRLGQVPGTTTIGQFLETVKTALGCEGLRYVSRNPMVCRVAVGGGGCAGGLMEAYKAGCDTFVTSDIRYNQFRDAYDLGMNLIDAGHFHTESPVCQVLAEKIAAQFPEIEVKLSKNQQDPMKFY